MYRFFGFLLLEVVLGLAVFAPLSRRRLRGLFFSAIIALWLLSPALRRIPPHNLLPVFPVREVSPFFFHFPFALVFLLLFAVVAWLSY